MRASQGPKVLRRTAVRRRNAWAAGAAIALALCAGVATRAHADEAGGRERDALYKFSFQRPDGLSPIPVSPSDAKMHVIRKWSQKDAAARGQVPETIVVLRSELVKAPVAGQDEVQEADTPPADLLEILKEAISTASGEHAAFVAPTDVQTKDDVPGRMWVTETKAGRNKKNLHVFAVWTKPDVQYAIWLSCGDEQRRKDEEVFKRVVTSFQWTDAKAKEASAQTALKEIGLTDEKRAEIEKGLVKGWAVLVSPKKQYVVVYNTKGKRNDKLAQMVAERIEQIRGELYELHFPPKKKIEDVSIIRICGDRAEYNAYGGPGWTAGYWNWRDGELVLYDSSPATKLDEDTLAVAYHEAFHQYIYYASGKLDPPSWFNEGTGDYFAGARSAGGKFTVRPFSWRIGTIKAALRAGPFPKKPDGTYDHSKRGYTPLVDFVHLSQDEYYDPQVVHVCYSQGWSLVYFLRELVPKNAEWNEKWGKILDTYFTTLRGKQENKVKRTGPVTPSGDAPPTAPPPAKKKPGLGEPGPVPEDDEGLPEPTGDPKAPPPPKPPGSGDEGMGLNEMPKIAPPPLYVPDDDTAGDIQAAFEAAFKGVDLKELEVAWRNAILQVPG
jgi:hypothetical protein